MKKEIEDLNVDKSTGSPVFFKGGENIKEIVFKPGVDTTLRK